MSIVLEKEEPIPSFNNSLASPLSDTSAKTDILHKDRRRTTFGISCSAGSPRILSGAIDSNSQRSWSYIFDSQTWKTMFSSKAARRSFRFPSVIDDDIQTYYAESIRNSKIERVLTWKQMTILAAMCVLYMAASITSSSLGILLPDLRTTFVDTDTSELGVMASMVTLGYALIQPFAGLLVPTLGPWKAVVLSSALAITGNLGFGLSRTIESADLFRLWTGLGCGMVYGIVWWFIKSETPPNKFGMLSGILEASNAFGTVIATIPLFYFEKALQWELFFTVILNAIILGACSVAVPLLLPYSSHLEEVLRSPKDIIRMSSTNENMPTEEIESMPTEENENIPTEDKSPPIPLSEVQSPILIEHDKEHDDGQGHVMINAQKSSFSSGSSARTDNESLSFSDSSSDSDRIGVEFVAWVSWKMISKDILTATNELGAFCVSFTVMGSMDALGMVWLVSMLQGMHGLSQAQAAFCVMISNFSVMPVIFCIGVLSDYVKLRLPFIYFGICIAALHVVLLGFLELSYPAAIVVSSLNGISQGFTSTAYAFAAESLSAKHTEQAVGWNQLFYMGGVTTMVSILGIVLDFSHASGSTDHHQYRLACVVVLCTVASAIIPCCILKETHGTYLKLN